MKNWYKIILVCPMVLTLGSLRAQSINLVKSTMASSGFTSVSEKRYAMSSAVAQSSPSRHLYTDGIRLLQGFYSPFLVGQRAFSPPSDMIIYPNPAQREVGLRWDKSEIFEPIEINLFNVNGTKVAHLLANRKGKNAECVLPSLPDGIYQFQVEGANTKFKYYYLLIIAQ